MSYDAKKADRWKYVGIGEERFKRIKMGSKGDLFYGEDKASTCGDCGAHMGHYHQSGCDLEVSPKTGDQLLSEADWFSDMPFDVSFTGLKVIVAGAFAAGVGVACAVKGIKKWKYTCKLARLYKEEHGIR